MLRRRRTTLLAACALALPAIAGCGADHDELGVEEPAREGLAVPLEGIEYNVFISRELNVRLPEDRAYYTGPEAKPGRVLFGVFLQACNRSKETHEAAEHFVIKDNQGEEYEPLEIEADNEFAYQPKRLAPKECIPTNGSVAHLGPSGGSLLLFDLPLETTENRPLELEVEGSFDLGKGEREKRIFELDI
jgi:hypothetical protein